MKSKLIHEEIKTQIREISFWSAAVCVRIVYLGRQDRVRELSSSGKTKAEMGHKLWHFLVLPGFHSLVKTTILDR